MASKILVVDDEKMIVKGIRYAMEHDGYEIDAAYDGETALEMIRNRQYDLVILDVMLPKVDGIQVCQTVRETSNVPIIMLTAKSEDMDKILGLEYGADDYMTKPFNILELKARVKAIIRRASASQAPSRNVMETGSLRIDYDSREVTVDGKNVNLTAKEFDLLELLSRNAGKVYSRDKLLDIIWGSEYPGDERTVDVHVRRLREKIEPKSSEPTYIQTKWGVGYFFKE
ncbi:MAG: response regulator transcription factor [Firmicutes bacterium]|nr:response regulator transcription factor [Bacillota bacterium]